MSSTMNNGPHVEPFEFLSRISLPVLKCLINQIRTQNLKTCQVDDLVPKLETLLDHQLSMLNGVYYPWFYRARITSSSTFSELTYPKSDYVTKLGRCNSIHEPLFYCSNCYATSILEVKPMLGDTVTVLVLDISDDMTPSRFIPIIPVGNDKLNDDLDNSFIYSRNPQINEKLKLINSFLVDSMLQDVATGEEWKYKLSIALSKTLTKHHHQYPCVIAFPSKASKHYGVNFAIPPKWVDTVDSPTYKAFRVKIFNWKNTFDMHAHIIEISKQMNDEGEFLFENVAAYNYRFPLNKDFYQGYEAGFKIQKAALPNGNFFRRYYPPPPLPEPYNLMDASRHIHIQDEERIKNSLPKFNIAPLNLWYKGVQSNGALKQINPWNL